jgi:aquaporin Z
VPDNFATILREHWPEYLIEGWGLGSLMISVCMFVTIFGSPASPAYNLIPSAFLRTLFIALAIGATLTALIHSPWGKRSGAHMNPAITLAFLYLGRIRRWDAVFYILAQAVGGTLGVAIVASIAGSWFTDPPVLYAVTVPGPRGVTVAFIAEAVTSFVLMGAILAFTTSPRLVRFTGLAVGLLVVVFMIIESPLSGTSLNPARTFASAVPGKMWEHVWIYFLAPTIGMLAATLLRPARGCAKLLHPRDVPCIHCAYRPQ